MRLANIIALVLMISAAVAAKALMPTVKIAEVNGKPDLEKIIPDSFGEWHLDKNQPVQVINPVQEETLNRIYDQTLSRTYVGPGGYRVMLSISYGSDQRSGVALSVHYPEVCYPAQGFEIQYNQIASVSTTHGVLPVRRLVAHHSMGRNEPVTYWITLGKYLTLGGVDRRLIELRYGIHREIPDGLLFRVSSIDSNSEGAFSLQEQFIKDLLLHLPVEARLRLAGSRVQ